MNFFYNIAIHLTFFVLKIISFFNKKIALFVSGRKNVYKELSNNFTKADTIIWFHCASLGEFEQGRPVIEKCKLNYPNVKILVTFFSPSGYEIRKDYKYADVVTYLPLDTIKNAKKFIEIVNPSIVIFVKYEFWPNFLKILKKKNIKTILISGIFRKDQALFKWYGNYIKKSLSSFDHFFVQNKSSKELLNNSGFTNVSVSGDTRFDRVYELTYQHMDIDIIKKFKENKTTLIAGSTWDKDEVLLVNFINNISTPDQRFIIAPHNIKPKEIEKLSSSISKKVTLLSKSEKEDINNYQVLIIDSIGLLSKIYYYADIAYVGGGFGTGIHNILEPATFAMPILIGPNYHKFNEAVELIKLKACIVINNQEELNKQLKMLFNSNKERKIKGEISLNYIRNNIGAAEIIFKYITEHISEN